LIVIPFTAKKKSGLCWLLLLTILVSGCASNLQTKVAGNLNSLSKNQTVAILPIEISDSGQKEMADMFRHGLYANLKQSKFNLLEKYIVDGLLRQNNLKDPSKFLNINPMRFGEVLGADAIVFTRINKVERTYFVVHSSIELSASVQMVDTRTGEILWRAEQTEHDFSGIGKIPTGITTALLAPIQFVTNKFNLRRMTSKMVDKLTALVKKPEDAQESTRFENPVIAKKATTDLKKIKELQELKSEWAQALDLDGRMESGLTVGETPLATQVEVAAKNKNMGSVKAKVRKVQKKESEEAALPPPEALEQKAPLPLNALRATLTAPAFAEKHEQIPSLSKNKKSPAPTDNLYTVQVGAYKTKAYAEILLKKLIKKGYNAFMTDNKIYRVQVEKFKNKEDALNLAQGIERKEKLKNFVTTFQPG